MVLVARNFALILVVCFYQIKLSPNALSKTSVFVKKKKEEKDGQAQQWARHTSWTAKKKKTKHQLQGVARLKTAPQYSGGEPNCKTNTSQYNEDKKKKKNTFPGWGKHTCVPPQSMIFCSIKWTWGHSSGAVATSNGSPFTWEACSTCISAFK